MVISLLFICINKEVHHSMSGGLGLCNLSGSLPKVSDEWTPPERVDEVGFIWIVGRARVVEHHPCLLLSAGIFIDTCYTGDLTSKTG